MVDTLSESFLLLATNFVGNLIKHELFCKYFSFWLGKLSRKKSNVFFFIVAKFCAFDIDDMVNQGRRRSRR